MDNWKWTDLMPGDKLKMNKELVYKNEWSREWINKLIKVERIQIKNGEIYVYFMNYGNARNSNDYKCNGEDYLYMDLNGEWQNCLLFDILELAED